MAKNKGRYPRHNKRRNKSNPGSSLAVGSYEQLYATARRFNFNCTFSYLPSGMSASTGGMSNCGGRAGGLITSEWDLESRRNEIVGYFATTMHPVLYVRYWGGGLSRWDGE
mgnify:CR=1 FL=1